MADLLIFRMCFASGSLDRRVLLWHQQCCHGAGHLCELCLLRSSIHSDGFGLSLPALDAVTDAVHAQPWMPSACLLPSPDATIIATHKGLQVSAVDLAMGSKRGDLADSLRRVGGVARCRRSDARGGYRQRSRSPVLRRPL
jgi:hypothetical protein